jgi:hypothetical protein
MHTFLLTLYSMLCVVNKSASVGHTLTLISTLPAFTCVFITQTFVGEIAEAVLFSNRAVHFVTFWVDLRKYY